MTTEYTYHGIFYGIDKVPIHILNDKNTMCIKCKDTRRRYTACKVLPEHMIHDSTRAVGYSVVLINATDTLTYLKLLGVEVEAITRPAVVADLDTLTQMNMHRLLDNFHVG